jgi:chromosome segregation ATPase
MRRTANALAVETDEVPVSSTELLEANVAAIRTDLSDLKAEFRAVVARIDQDIRAMAAKAESEIKTAVARIDEQFREVRQDVRELRVGMNGLQADNKTLRDKIDATHASLSAKIDGVNSSLDKKIDARSDELRGEIKEVRGEIKDVRGEMKEMRGEMHADRMETRASVAELKAMQKAILWVLGSLVTLVAIAGTGFTIAKTVRWI